MREHLIFFDWMMTLKKKSQKDQNKKIKIKRMSTELEK
jgi:hypothetical protein